MSDAYDLFSKYYRELTYFSGHFKAEKRVLTQIMRDFARNNQVCKILDGACGTGDTLFKIFNQGYSNIAGLDGSAKDNQIIVIDDKCDYIDDRQYITYKIAEEGSQRNELFFSVDYAIISSNEYLKNLLNTGFRNCNTSLYPSWPYELIYAIK